MLKQQIESAIMKLNVLRFLPNKNIKVNFDKQIIIDTNLFKKLIIKQSSQQSHLSMYI
jgi:hypothetical protein